MNDLESLYQDLILDHAKHPHGRAPLDKLGDRVDAPGDGADAPRDRADALGDRADTPGDRKLVSQQRNPVCGDEVTLHADVVDGVVRAITWTGDGCSISQASASMLASLVAEEGGMPVARARELLATFREALRSRGAVALDEQTFGDAAALSGVSKYTARVKCAMLAWVAMEDVLARS